MAMSLKRLLMPMVTAAALASSVQAAPPPVVATAPVPLLWKVSDADNSLYLLGSFHLLKPSDYPLSKDVDAAFADAESVVFEMSPEEMASPTLAMQMGQAALRTDGTQLDSELPPATAARLHAWLAANDADMQASGVPAQLLQNFEAWFVGLTISIIEMTHEGLDPKLGLDQHFAAAAKARPMPVLPLVGSIKTVLPGWMRPDFSASSIMLTPMRSFTLWHGLKPSSFTATVALA